MIALGNLIQFQDMNGSLLAAGYVFVYHLGRSELATIYNDHNGAHVADNPVRLDDMGMCDIYLNECYNYTVVVMDAYGQEMFSRDLYPNKAGGGDGRYEGVDPIVVNNDVNVISANTTHFGVQEPLYFVRDDESATIIGFSGSETPAGTMNESALDYQDGKITSYNGSAFSAGNTYEAGSYIDISGDTIMVTGLSPIPADTASTGLVASVSADITAMIPDVSDMATQTWVNEQGFLTAHQDISNKLDTTAFSTVSGDFLTAVPSEYVTENTLQSGLSSKLDSTAFSTVSGNFLTAHQSLEGYATENWVTSQGYLTEHQSLDGLMSADLLESSGGLITGYNGSAFAGQGGGVTGDYELSAGSGISIVDYPLEQKTVISVTAQGGNPEVENLVIANSATWDSVTGKADTTALNDYATTSQLANKLDTTAFSTVSGNFLTAHQDISNKLDTTAFSDVSGSFLTAVPDTYLQNTDLSTADGKVTAISGIPLSAGGDVPKGVMVESGLEYNAVNEISGYNGSAIAQYGAEKQWLVHDDTLVHAANSAQYALGVNLSALQRLMGIDETVLWEGDVLTNASTKTGTYAESLSAFNTIKVVWRNNDTGSYRQFYCPASSNNQYFADVIVYKQYQKTFTVLTNQTGFTDVNAYERTINTTGAASNSPMTGADNQAYHLLKIVGIGRKEV